MEFLKELGVNEFNQGACFGPGEWSETQDKGIIESFNPANRETIGKVYGASQEDYERIMTRAQEVFEDWRMVPAPKRGEAVRLCTEALREPVIPRRVALISPATHRRPLHEELFGTDIRWDADENVIDLPAEVFERPLPGSVPEVAEASEDS